MNKFQLAQDRDSWEEGAPIQQQAGLKINMDYRLIDGGVDQIPVAKSLRPEGCAKEPRGILKALVVEDFLHLLLLTCIQDISGPPHATIYSPYTTYLMTRSA